MSALLSLLLVLVLPTSAGIVALSDGPARRPRGSGTADTEVAVSGWDVALARGLACGLSTWFLGSGILARTVGLTTTSTWVWDAVVAAVSVGVLLHPRQRGRVGLVLRPVLGRFAQCAGLTAVVFLPVAVAIVRTSWSPLGSTPWYYYGLARQVADLGSIPATSVEFGTTTPFLNDYHLFTTATAMLLVQHPGGPITVLTIVALLSALLLGLGSVALATTLGADRVAALVAAPVSVASGLGVVRLSGYRPEGLALALVVLMAALTVDWLRHRSWSSLVTAALLAAVLSQVHGIAAVTAGAMVLASVAAFVVLGPHGEQLRRGALTIVLYAAAVVVVGLVFHEASGTATAGGLVDQGGLADPTWEFYRAARAYLPTLPPSNGRMLGNVPLYIYGRSWWWVSGGVVLACIGLWRRRREPDSRLVVVFTVLTLLVLALVSSVFMFNWDGYVPRRTGASRIPLEASLVVPPFIACGMACLARERWRWRGRTVPERRRSAAFLVAVVVCGLLPMFAIARHDAKMAPSREDIAVWRSLPLKRGDVVLANAYTEGFIPDMSDAVGLLDGRAPYTFGGQLTRANDLLRDAESFYTDPARHWSFLRDHDVSWVIVGDPSTYALSTNNTWHVPSDLSALERCPGLERVAGDQRIMVFRVVDARPAGCRPTG